MKHLSAFQTAELILIPLTFFFSQIIIILFGLEIIGENTWILMGIPIGIGVLVAIVLLVVVNNAVTINEFRQLEVMFRIITIIGGILFILILGIQIVFQITGILIFSLLTLVISIIGDIMTFQCISFLLRYILTQDHLELSEHQQ